MSKQVGQVLWDRDPGIGIDELRHFHRVDVRVRRVLDRHLTQFFFEGRINHTRMVDPHRVGDKEGKEIEKTTLVSGVDYVRSLASFHVKNQVHSIRQQVLGQCGMNISGANVYHDPLLGNYGADLM
jgi:hypothetical protein